MIGRDRRIATALFVFALALYLLSASGHFYASDDVQKLHVLQSWFSYHTFAIPDGWVTGRDGARYAWFPLGASLVMLPGYLAGLALAPWMHGLAVETVIRLVISLQNALVVALTVAIAYGWLRWHDRPARDAVTTALLLATGTTLWPYAKTAWSEPTATLFLLLGLWCLLLANQRHSRPRLLGSGTCLAIGVAIRTEYLIPALMASIWWWFTQRISHRQRLSDTLHLLLPLTGVLLLNAWYDQLRYGTIWHHPNYTLPQERIAQEGRFGHVLLNFWQYTLSPNQGIIWYSPPVLLACRGIRSLWQTARPTATLLLGTLLPLWLFYVLAWGVSSWAWGLRYNYVFVPFLLVLGCFGLQTWSRHSLYALAISGAAVQFLAILVNPINLYESELARFPGLTIQQLMTDPQHNPLLLAIQHCAGLIHHAWLPPSPLPSHAWHAARTHLPDLWVFLQTLAHRPSGGSITLACSLIACLWLSGWYLCQLLRHAPGKVESPDPATEA